MRVNQVISQIARFFDESSECSRIFLHARAATTDFVGIGYLHGFTDFNGRIIMHNGIIRNDEHLSIDSYRLVNLPFSTSNMLEYLQTNQDTYANVFVIDTQEREYTVLRMITGSLHTDGQGNFSTNRLASIDSPVAAESAETFQIQEEQIDIKYLFNPHW